MKINYRGITSAFTLPELLIVMTVIAGMAAIMMVSYPASQKRSRDTIRISDIKQYQTAIEVYANRNGSYSGLTNGNPGSSGNCTTLGLTRCPSDPRGTPQYELRVTATNYAAWARLELFQPPATASYFVICSDGRSGKCATPPSGATCPAACP